MPNAKLSNVKSPYRGARLAEATAAVGKAQRQSFWNAAKSLPNPTGASDRVLDTNEAQDAHSIGVMEPGKRLTYAQINALFCTLDESPELLSLDFDGWLAWAIVKERLWLAYLRLNVDGGNIVLPKPKNAVLRCLSGFWQILRGLASFRRYRGILLYEERRVVLGEGSSVHPQIGDIRKLERDGAWLRYRFPWGAGGAALPPSGTYDDYSIGAVSAAIARLVRAAPGVCAAAEKLTQFLAPHLLQLDAPNLKALVADQLARFRVRFWIARRLFGATEAREVVVVDPDGKTPEVAAALSLGLRVTEIQHGMFDAREPDYSWSAKHRSLAARMPLPDRIVVFGSFWADQLQKAGYWPSGAVICARNALIADCRSRAKNNLNEGAPVTILFPSQSYMRAEAIAFWAQLLAHQTAQGEKRFELRIKIHPLETADADIYNGLCERYPDVVAILGPNIDPYQAIVAADLVVGYTSFMLVEALAIGVAVAAIRQGTAADGFGATFDFPAFDQATPAICNAISLWNILESASRGPKLEAIRRSALPIAAQVHCADGPAVHDIVGLR